MNPKYCPICGSILIPRWSVNPAFGSLFVAMICGDCIPKYDPRLEDDDAYA